MVSIEVMINLMDLTHEQLRSALEESGWPPYAATQIFDWLYKKGCRRPDQMTNLSRERREELLERFILEVLEPVETRESADGTRKHLFPAGRGRDGSVECVFIPDGDRGTLCISSQVGCRRGCGFCATGVMGFAGNLSAGQIVSQYLSVPEREQVTNIVFMGMGEPLDNLENVLGAIRNLTDPKALGLSSRRITLSTVGIHPHVSRVIRETDVHIAISLHSPFPEQRRLIVPAEIRNPVSETIREIREAQDNGLLRRDRKVSFEYTLLDGFNDTPDHARALARLLAEMRCRINLIPFNPFPEANFRRSPDQTVDAFRRILIDRGLRATVRRSRGQDIEAACGLLATRSTIRQKARTTGS
ncbi:MAG: 23S rRNA (adenine(2503)-C(2))-methyltransferase RlmN [Alkalispirochaetaceae bacterium]